MQVRGGFGNCGANERSGTWCVDGLGSQVMTEGRNVLGHFGGG